VGTFTIKAGGIIKNENCKIGIRSEEIVISREPPDSGYYNVAKGKIVDYADLGPMVVVDVDIGLPVKVIVSKRQYLEMQLGRSDDVWLSFAPESVKILE